MGCADGAGPSEEWISTCCLGGRHITGTAESSGPVLQRRRRFAEIDHSLSSYIKAEKPLYRIVKKSSMDMASSNQKVIAALLQNVKGQLIGTHRYAFEDAGSVYR